MQTHENESAIDRGPAKSVLQRATVETAAITAYRSIADGRHGALSAASLIHLQRAAGNASVSSLIGDNQEEEGSSVKSVIGSDTGVPLDQSTRHFMEDRLASDFGDVRVHTDAKATDSARSLNAQAYTVGTDIVFRGDKYAPESNEGRRVLAHELTHVVQQKAGPVEGTAASGGITVSDPSDRFERAAGANAERVMSTTQASPSGGIQSAVAAPPSIQREGADEEVKDETPPPQRQVQREDTEEEA